MAPSNYDCYIHEEGLLIISLRAGLKHIRTADVLLGIGKDIRLDTYTIFIHKTVLRFLLQDTLPAILGSPSDFGDLISIRRPAFLADTPASPYNRRDTKVDKTFFFYSGLSLLCMTSAASTLLLKRLISRSVSSRFNYPTTRRFSQSSVKMLITQNKPRIILGCMTFGCV